MPCPDCEKNPKLRAAVICPDPWIDGARTDASSAGRKKSENKLLTSKAKYSGSGLGVEQKCCVCRKQLVAGGKYCQECAHRKGLCYICGKQILDTKFYTHHDNPNDPRNRKRTGDGEPKPVIQKPTVNVPKRKADDSADFAEQQAQRAASKKVPTATADSANTAAKTTSEQGGAGSVQPLRTVGNWVELQSAEGQLYYYNSTTGVTQWTAPPELASAAGGAEEPEGGAAKGGGETGEWVQVQAEQGVYYYNSRTLETTWERPAGFVPPAGGASGA